MNKTVEQCSRDLRAGAMVLAPVLEPFGFRFSAEFADFASAGAFANGFFDSDRLRIGLIVRHKSGLGSVNYESGDYQCGHDELLSALGVGDRSRISYEYGSGATRARDGGDPFTALADDLRDLFLPIWIAQPLLVETTIRILREQWLRKMRIPLPRS